MPSIYDDPELQQTDEYPDQVNFKIKGDSVRGRILRTEPITTKFGKVAKYWLFDLDRQMERTMLAGSKNLWGQLLELKPDVGDVVSITMIGSSTNDNGTAKLFDVKVVEFANQQSATQQTPQSEPSPPPRPRPAASDDGEEDMFDR